MDNVLRSLSQIFDMVIGWCIDVVNVFTAPGNELLFVIVVIPIIGGVIKIVRKLIHL